MNVADLTNDHEFEEVRIASVTPEEGGWQIRREDGWCFFCPVPSAARVAISGQRAVTPPHILSAASSARRRVGRPIPGSPPLPADLSIPSPCPRGRVDTLTEYRHERTDGRGEDPARRPGPAAD